MSLRHIACLILLTLPCPLQAADKRPVRETDLLDFTWIGDAQISPDGTQIVFVRVGVNEEKDRYETALYTGSPADGRTAPRPLTSGPYDMRRAGRRMASTLAFRARGGERRQAGTGTDLSPVDWGGEARALTDRWRRARRASDVVAGRKADRLHVIRRYPEDRKGGSRRKEKERRARDHARVYRFNGAGYTIPSASRPYLGGGGADAGGADARSRGSSPGAVSTKQACLVARRQAHLLHVDPLSGAVLRARGRRLYAVPATGGEIVRRGRASTARSTTSRLSPDGQRIAFLGSSTAKPARSYNQPDLFVTDARARRRRRAT